MKSQGFLISGAQRMFVLVAVLLTSSCGSPNGTGPAHEADPGFVRVEVTGPASPDVAFKFRVTGGGVDSVSGASGTVYFETLGPTIHRAIVVGSTDRTRLIEFWMPDRRTLDTYGVNLEEVADADTYQNLSVAAYFISIGK